MCFTNPNLFGSNNLSVILLNARSIQNKYRELELFVSAYPFDVICITESWISDANAGYFFLNGYESYVVGRKPSEERAGGGGVIILVRASLVSSELKLIHHEDPWLECVSVELQLERQRTCLISCIYRSPKATVATDQTFFELLQTLGNQPHNQLCVVGDFNLPLIRWDTLQWPSSMEPFIDAIYENGWNQFVDFPTRANNILDLVFTSGPNDIDEIEPQPGLTQSADHLSVVFQLKVVPSVRNCETNESVRNWRRTDWPKLKSAVARCNFQAMFSTTIDVQQNWVEVRGVPVPGTGTGGRYRYRVPVAGVPARYRVPANNVPVPGTILLTCNKTGLKCPSH